MFIGYLVSFGLGFASGGTWRRSAHRGDSAGVGGTRRLTLLLLRTPQDRQNMANAKVLNAGQEDSIEKYWGLEGAQ